MSSIIVPGAGPERPAGRRSPAVRVGAALASWALFAMCFTLLALGALQVMVANGGFCARGGPYEIASGHECSDAVVAVMPLSIFGLIGAIALGALTGGFGLPLLAWGWPILFVGLGAVFAVAGIPTMAWAFLLCAVLFVVMGLVPLVLSLRAAWRQLLAGTADARGTRFAGVRGLSVGTMSYTRPAAEGEGTRPAGAGDVALAWLVSGGGAALGVWAATAIWAALS